jgi:hypothetical protein
MMVCLPHTLPSLSLLSFIPSSPSPSPSYLFYYADVSSNSSPIYVGTDGNSNIFPGNISRAQLYYCPLSSDQIARDANLSLSSSSSCTNVEVAQNYSYTPATNNFLTYVISRLSNYKK